MVNLLKATYLRCQNWSLTDFPRHMRPMRGRHQPEPHESVFPSIDVTRHCVLRIIRASWWTMPIADRIISNLKAVDKGQRGTGSQPA
jgi:hypothetical protein